MQDISIFSVWCWVLSFISPCCLPLYPAFLSYITGMSVSELKEENAMLRKRSMIHTAFSYLDFQLYLLQLDLVQALSGAFYEL